MKLVRIIFIGLIVSLSVGATETRICPSTPFILPIPVGYDHNRYAPVQKERLYEGGSFVASVDSYDDDNEDGKAEYLVQPAWVAYHLKEYRSQRGSNYAPSFKKPRNWYRIELFDEERELYGTNKRVDDSYDGVGKVWNRGHLAQRADSNRLSEAYGCNTHVFANAIPQKAGFNQGIWLGLENYVSSLSNQRGELWVVTGPIYIKEGDIKTIGDRNRNEIPVAIPDFLFKVIFMESDIGVEVISFIYPNKYDVIPSEYQTGKCQRDRQYNHIPFMVSLFEVEQMTGLTFFADSIIELEKFKKVKATELPVLESQNIVGYCL